MKRQTLGALVTIALLATGCGRGSNTSNLAAHRPDDRGDTADGLGLSQCAAILARATTLVENEGRAPIPQPVVLSASDINCLSFELALRDRPDPSGTMRPSPYQALLPVLFDMAQKYVGQPGGGGGGPVLPPGQGLALAAGIYISSPALIPGCTAANVTPRTQAGVLRYIDVSCSESQTQLRFDCTGTACSDAAGDVLEVFDGNMFSMTVAQQRSDYTVATVLHGDFGPGTTSATVGNQDIAIDVAVPGVVNSVVVELRASESDATNFDDYTITLVAPDGTKITLQTAKNGDTTLAARANRNVRFGDVADAAVPELSKLLGKVATGKWHVNIQDDDADTGTLEYLQLHFQ